MRLRLAGTLSAMLTGLLFVSVAPAQNTTRKKPRHLEVLNRYVGTWSHTVTLLPSNSLPEKKTQQVTEQTEWTLDDSFIMGREVNHTTGQKNLWLFTASRIARRPNPFWFFDSGGAMSLVNGQWDDSNQTMTFKFTDLPNGWTGTGTHRFSGDSYVSSLSIMDDAGQKTVDVHDLKKRLAGNAGQRMLDTWSKTGKSDSPVPDELKELERLVGDWTEKQTMRIPVKVDVQNELTFEWILDGRFLLGTTKSTRGTVTRLRVIGFDASKMVYRLVNFQAGGQTSEALGQWDDTTGVVNWRMPRESKHIESKATWEFTDDGTLNWHVSRKAGDKTVLDLMIRLDRNK